METTQEFEPVSEERRLAVAEFIQGNFQPVLRVINEGHELAELESAEEFQVRKYQLEAWASIWDARQAGRDKALLHLATGLGKTTVAAFDVMKFRDECAQQDPPMIPRVLYVSHKNEINEQAEKTFRHFMPELETATFDTKQKELPDADVTFATFQSLHSKLDRFDPQDYEYIIWDEGHHTKAETYMEVVEHFDPLFEMAITATPNRADGKDIREYFGEEVYSKGLPEAIAEGWLANVDYHIVFDKAIKNAIAGGFSPKTLKDIKDLFAEKPPAEAIAKNIREEAAKLGLENPKTIVFCADIADADEMAEFLGGTAYHSDTKDRPQVLQDFREGRKRIITTRDMFNEGVDIPDAELIVFLRSTQSSNIFEQQLGRGLRRAPGKDRVYVLDFVANIERISKVQELGKAIQERAEEIGEGRPVEEGVILGGGQDEPGLRISSSHGNFDFDKLAVDLLEKWGSLPSFLLPPEGWVSINGAAQDLGISYQFAAQVVQELGWELPEFRFGILYAGGLSPDQVEILRTHPSVQRSDEFLGISDIRKQYGIHDTPLNKMIESMGWDLPYHKIGEGSKRGRALTRAQVEELQARFPDNFLDPMPEGYQSVKEAASHLGLGARTLRNIIAEREWVLPRYKSRGGPAAYALSPDRILELQRDQSNEPPIADDSIVSLKGLEKEFNAGPETVERALADADVAPERYRFQAVVSLGIKSRDIEKVRSALIPTIPDGWSDIPTLANELGVSDRTIRNNVASENWELPTYRGAYKPVKALNPDQVQYLKNKYGR